MTQMVRDRDGKLSFTRLSGFLVILTWLGIAVYQGATAGKVIDIPEFWLLLVIGLYGLGQTAEPIVNLIGKMIDLRIAEANARKAQ